MFCVVLLTIIMAFGKGGTNPLRWPSGKYGLPNTIYGCPRAEGFRWATGNISQALKPNNKKSSSFHLKASVTSKGVERSFCFKNALSQDPARPEWPTGKYCIYRKGRKCPKGLKSGSLLWDNRFDFYYNKASGVVPDGGTTSSNTLIYFCCATIGDKTTPIDLPLESPFFLLAYLSEACQEVHGALHRNEFIYYNTDGKNTLKPPHPYGANQYSVRINYCYYQACWNNLTALNGTIMSPFYPTNYPSNTSCRWRITVPSEYTITLEFEDIDLESSPSCTNEWLKVSTGNQLSPPLKYCTKRSYPKLDSNSNVVVVDFHSDEVPSLNKGFNIRYQARRIPVSMTTTTQPTVVRTTSSQTTTNLPATTIPTERTTTILEEGNKTTTREMVITQPTTRKQDHISTTEDSDYKPTESINPETSTEMSASPFIDISCSSSPSTPVIREARTKDSKARVWVVPVVVCLSILVVTAIGIFVYLKCLRKRNTAQQRNSTVKYDRNGDYIDMEYQREEDEESRKLKKKECQGPVYEEIDDTLSTGKGHSNNVYESTATMNQYDTPQRTPREVHVYESATLPPNK